MQDPDSFSAFQPDQADNLAEELYPDIFSTTFPPIKPGPATSSELRSLRSSPHRATGTEELAARARARRSTDRVGAIQEGLGALSLTEALQSTISRNRPKKSQLVITSEKKRERDTDRVYRVRSEPAWQFTPRLRLVILIVVIVLILLAILLFPVGLSMSREAFPAHLALMSSKLGGQFFVGIGSSLL